MLYSSAPDLDFPAYPARDRTHHAFHRNLSGCPGVIFTGELSEVHTSVQLPGRLSNNAFKCSRRRQFPRKFVDSRFREHALADTHQPPVTYKLGKHPADLSGASQRSEFGAQNHKTLSLFDGADNSVFKLHFLRSLRVVVANAGSEPDIHRHGLSCLRFLSPALHAALTRITTRHPASH
jgi:hypothetical protein